MTAVTATRQAVTDWRLMAVRCLTRARRTPSLVVYWLVQPLVFVLLFRYVFGGAIDAGGSRYVDYLFPGILVYTAAFGATGTATGLAEDVSTGFLDRVRSMPTARSTVLVGRVASDTVINFGILVITLLVGFAVGFRVQTGIAQTLAMLGLATCFGVATAAFGAWVGLALRSAEGASATMLTVLFPFAFASSAFVPVDTMPSWLAAFAGVNPVTVVTDATRVLALGGFTAGDALATFAWIAALVAVFGALAVRSYRRA